MPRKELSIEHLADAVIDGVAVDWTEVESIAGETDRPLVRCLQLVAAVAQVHQRARVKRCDAAALND